MTVLPTASVYPALAFTTTLPVGDQAWGGRFFPELPDGTITPRYKFNHVLYLEVPYRLLPAMRRSLIHRRIGQSGEAIEGGHPMALTSPEGP